MNKTFINTTLLEITLPIIIGSLIFFMTIYSHAHTHQSIIPLESVNKEVDINQKIELIRQIYTDINNNLSRYQQYEIDNSGQSTEGGFYRFYTQNKELKKVEEVYFGETGKKSYEYYYDQNKLYFIFEQSIYYNAPIYYTEATPESEAFDIKKSIIEEDRYYFFNGEMIQWLDKNKKNIPTQSKTFKNKQQQLLNQSFFI